jgi:hypothetical protein
LQLSDVFGSELGKLPWCEEIECDVKVQSYLKPAIGCARNGYGSRWSSLPRSALLFTPLHIPSLLEAGLFYDNFVLLFLIQLARWQFKLDNLKCCRRISVLKKNCRKMKATSN